MRIRWSLLLLFLLVLSSRGLAQPPQKIPLDAVSKAYLLLEEGNQRAQTGQPLEALPLYEKARQIFEQEKEERGVALCWYNTGNVYLDVGRPNEALAMFEQVRPVFEKVGDPQQVALCDIGVGNVYMSTNRPTVEAVEGRAKGKVKGRGTAAVQRERR